MTDGQTEACEAQGVLSDDLKSVKANIRKQQQERLAKASEEAASDPLYAPQPAEGPLSEQVGGDHYKAFAIQPIEFCQRNRLPPLESSIIKYVCRHGLKGGAQDLQKAFHCLRILMWMEYEQTHDGCRVGKSVLHSMYIAQDDRARVYIAAPYTSDPANNTRRALALADEVWRLGYWPIVPHLTHWWHERTPRSYDRWLEYGKALARCCNVILRDKKKCPGLSPGADEEERLGIPVVYSLDELRQRFPPASVPRKEGQKSS